MRRISLLIAAAQIFILTLLANGGKPAAQSVTPDDAATQDWAIAKSKGTTEAFETFLQKHWNSRYAKDAFGEIVRENLEKERSEQDEPDWGGDTFGASDVLQHMY